MVNAISVTLRAKVTLLDSQRFPGNFYVINNVQDIVVFYVILK